MTDWMTITTAVISQPCGIESAMGSTMNEFLVDNENARVRPWSARSRNAVASSRAITSAAARKSAHAKATQGSRLRCSCTAWICEAATRRITSPRQGTGNHPACWRTDLSAGVRRAPASVSAATSNGAASTNSAGHSWAKLNTPSKSISLNRCR